MTSQQLLSWSTSIDQAEDYEMFLNGLFNSSMASNNDMLFYNCTAPWFGPHCRFAFELSINTSFDDIVNYTFASKSTWSNNDHVPCYTHLTCQPVFVCLDWREICDHKFDCVDGSDETNCWQVAMNECSDDEYRCYNGQCIPQEFLRDDFDYPDCLDGADELIPDALSGRRRCFQDPSFRCEERACPPTASQFQCGDGECNEEISPACNNGRGNTVFTDICSIAMVCVQNVPYQSSIYGPITPDWCINFCKEIKCGIENCSSFHAFPSNPVLFGHVRFVFQRKQRRVSLRYHLNIPDYVCYDEQLCADFLPATEHLDGLACRRFDELGLGSTIRNQIHFRFQIQTRFRSCLTTFNEMLSFNNSMTYHCLNSRKWISKHSLVDGIQDCPFNDDETFNESCTLNDVRNRFNCSTDGIHECVAAWSIGSVIRESCGQLDYYDQRTGKPAYSDEINFPTICDGIVHRFPVLIEEQVETDETHCEHWECNNTYTRCNEFWSCRNGADESGCSQSNYSEVDHRCVFPNDTTKISRLPMSRVGDGVVDCLGATDEPFLCRVVAISAWSQGFKCLNENSSCLDDASLVCNQDENCIGGDDEIFCCTLENPCDTDNQTLRTDVEDFRRKFNNFIAAPDILSFVLRNMLTYPQQLIDDTISLVLPMENKTEISNKIDVVDVTNIDLWRCHRGISIQVRMDDNTVKPMCLCPPSYYGDECQFQNQRVSLTVQIRATSNWRSMFILFITLVDNERNIQTHDHIEYLPIRDCQVKFDIYLLYSTRPKNAGKNYSVQIDAFEQSKFQYRASWIFPLQFSFLPVHRLSVLLIIPNNLIVESAQSCQLPCLHGQCVSYVNNPSASFCRCFLNWSGAQCHVQHTCNCASHSLCISNSICLCSLNHYGSRCHLLRSSCHSDYCLNRGQCISNDERGRAIYSNEPTCTCPIAYGGNRCERRETRIDISFHDKLTIPSALFIHLITVKEDKNPSGTSTMKKIPFDQNSVTFFTSVIFNIALVEFSNDYYLIILREQPIYSIDISTQVVPSHRCLSINELFNQTIVDQDLLKRIKLYHLPCRERFELICFYDSKYICVCDNDHLANCFIFDRPQTYNCRSNSLCENDGQCFEDDSVCPTSSSCACPQCYFGSRCQSSTKGSTLSLDIILGYRIQSNLKINQQPSIVKFAIALTIIILIAGWISNFFSYLTFRTKETRTVGCGYYLFALSITSLLSISVLMIKFWLLLAAQMGSINNHLFLNIQCRSMDYILRVLLGASDWLTACVAIERTVNVTRGVNFHKTKSIKVAKWMIGIVYLFAFCAHLHDPIYRHLLNDEEEQRTWCLTKYSFHIQIYDWIVNIFHFALPFAINCISGIMIIITATRARSNVLKKESFRKILREQLHFHRHLLISPFILVCLAIPRLIISFLFGCMKSTRDSWLYLIGYFIRFISPMLTFAIFILPSEVYQKEFNKSIKCFFKC